MIDIHSLISETLEASARSVASHKFSLPQINEKISGLAETDYALMNYSTLLLSKYHEALRSELSRQGIEV